MRPPSNVAIILRAANQVIGEEVGGYADLHIIYDDWKLIINNTKVHAYAKALPTPEIYCCIPLLKHLQVHEIVRIMIHEYCHLMILSEDPHSDLFYRYMEKMGCKISGERDDRGYRKEYLSPFNPIVKKVNERIQELIT